MNMSGRHLGRALVALAALTLSVASMAETRRILTRRGTVRLGHSFASDVDEPFGNRCVTGVPRVRPGLLSRIFFDRPLAFEELQQVLGFSASLDDVDGPERAGGWLEVLDAAVRRRESRSLVYFYDLQVGSLAYESAVPTAFARARLEAGVEAAAAACGDSYVRSVELGGWVLVVVNLSFPNEQVAQGVGADMGLENASLYELGGRLRRVTTALRDGVSITLRAHQLGGRPEELTRLLVGANGSPIVRCSLANIDACDGVLRAVYDYTTRADGFRGQFDLATLDPEGEAALPVRAFDVETYASSGIEGLRALAHAPPSQAERDARLQVVRAYLATREDVALGRSTLTLRLAPRNREAVRAELVRVERRAAMLRAASESCRVDVASCPALWQGLAPHLPAYRPELLRKRLDFLDYCLMPDSTADVMRFLDVLRARLSGGSCEELAEALANASVLDLSDAGLTTIAPLYGGPGEDFSRLILDGNPIGDVSVLNDLPRLVELSARRLGLREAPDLAAVPELKWLDLAYNQLERVDPDRLPPDLRGLAMHGNPLVEDGTVAVVAPVGARLIATEAAVCARERDWMRERRAITSEEHRAFVRDGLAPRYPLVDARSTERVSWQPCATLAPYYRGLW